MSKPDNHIDETLADILHSLAWSGKYTDAGQEVVSELDIERAKNRLDQYYADFYRNKILEARLKELHDFKNNGVAGRQQYLDKRIARLTAQFNSEEE